jgi:hypothetical protein
MAKVGVVVVVVSADMEASDWADLDTQVSD